MLQHHTMQHLADLILNPSQFINLPLNLRPLQRPRLINVHPRLLSLNLPDRPREILPRKQIPRPKRPHRHNPHSNRGIIQRLTRNRIHIRQTEDYRDEPDPQTRDQRHWSREDAEIEGALFEILVPDKADQDWQAIGDVEGDGGDAGGGCEGYGGA